MGGDADPLQEAGIIEVAAARPGNQHRPERIEPDFVGMGGELVAVVGIAGRISDDALARAPYPVERRADIGDGGLAAADEDVEIERHRADARVGGGGVERVDQFGDAIFAGDRTAAQRRERIARRRLLDDARR